MKKLLIIFTLLFLTVGCKTKRAVVVLLVRLLLKSKCKKYGNITWHRFLRLKPLWGVCRYLTMMGKTASPCHCHFVWKKIRLYGCQLRWV